MSEPVDMRERVARAIDAARGPNDSIYNYADAAIAAMLAELENPSPELLRTCCDAYDTDSPRRSDAFGMKAAFAAAAAHLKGRT